MLVGQNRMQVFGEKKSFRWGWTQWIEVWQKQVYNSQTAKSHFRNAKQENKKMRNKLRNYEVI